MSEAPSESPPDSSSISPPDSSSKSPPDSSSKSPPESSSKSPSDVSSKSTSGSSAQSPPEVPSETISDASFQNILETSTETSVSGQMSKQDTSASSTKSSQWKSVAINDPGVIKLKLYKQPSREKSPPFAPARSNRSTSIPSVSREESIRSMIASNIKGMPSSSTSSIQSMPGKLESSKKSMSFTSASSQEIEPVASASSQEIVSEIRISSLKSDKIIRYNPKYIDIKSENVRCHQIGRSPEAKNANINRQESTQRKPKTPVKGHPHYYADHPPTFRKPQGKRVNPRAYAVLKSTFVKAKEMDENKEKSNEDERGKSTDQASVSDDQEK